MGPLTSTDLEHARRSRARASRATPCAQNALNNRSTTGTCKCVTFKKHSAHPVHVWRCDARRLKGHNTRQCRKGPGKSFKMRQFKKCAR